jgi:hypothetical protein
MVFEIGSRSKDPNAKSQDSSRRSELTTHYTAEQKHLKEEKMNRNQKIALGCGGAGCLGLIVVIIAGVLLYMFAGSSQPTNRSRNSNFNSSSNSNRSTNRSSETNSSNSNSVAPSSSMSEDDKHKLFQAAGVTGDADLVKRVLHKIGYADERGVPTSGYPQFIQDHASWLIKNYDFVASVNTAEKGRAYCNDHLDD